MLQIQLLNAEHTILGTSHPSGDGVALVHAPTYQAGDHILLTVDKAGLYDIQLDEALGKHTVYIKDRATYEIPTEDSRRTCFPKQAFTGENHLLTLAKSTRAASYRNLALNPYDNHHTLGIFPHAQANVETRNEMQFAARNAIDGVLENSRHGSYPYTSWGINQDPKAELTVDFGRPVTVDLVRITLRADWPHDSWWKEATITFSDNTQMVCPLKKDPLPQSFPMEKKTITSIRIERLIKGDETPYPALTQLEVFGTDS
ncbi:discoidin domain-containing protein [Sphaerochaeta sp. PS]|uniref:discoidin domain-containing protein n=1 Tax=Sphaerochaeta sp. PS TaxID=3076336 RepID=UPI0028A402AE|nr:discoidin domain-containing protein [Sphaerochaeta sp. PS]MDT4762236.1 discoidin domain-containing protein [Sphaerochaeta sp. PS]